MCDGVQTQTEKRGGFCVRRAYRVAFDVNYDQDAEARRTRRHTVTAHLPLDHAATSVEESVHLSSGCGVISAVIAHH